MISHVPPADNTASIFPPLCLTLTLCRENFLRNADFASIVFRRPAGGPCFAGAFHFFSQTSPRALLNLVFAHSSRRSPGCRSLLRSHRDGCCSHCGTSAAARNLNFTLWLNQEGGSHILFIYFFFFLILFFFFFNFFGDKDYSKPQCW